VSGVFARSLILLTCLVLTDVAGCGSRTDARRSIDGGERAQPLPERCNGLDDDGVNGVDDPFRDARGRYVADAHCGACNAVCAPRSPAELVTHCDVIDEVPLCVAERCAAGFAPTRQGRCEALVERLCLPCANDNDCGLLSGARCASIGGESRCSVDCALGCPSGYQCDAAARVCVPMGGSCSCTAGDTFELACASQSDQREPGAPVCVGRATCQNGVLSACSTSVEVCDHDDNDCDGQVDEGFADVRGAYSLDPANCGECGVSCLEDTGTELDLACGGDPFAPTCTLACPDARNGTGVGDLLDGDLDIATGCECQVTATEDAPGPVGASGAALDVNCDGADGEVLTSFFVATDGDDSYVGSPTRPLRTIGAAIRKARDSLAGELVRPHVYVAAGTYTETLELADGVLVHGGYRRDFRAADPAAFLTEVRAPADTMAPGGAALVGTAVGGRATLVEGISLRGLDASGSERATIGAYLERPLPGLTLRALTIRTGVPGDGITGADGAAGGPPMSLAAAGDQPRAAIESQSARERSCLPNPRNNVRGGAGGQNSCGGSDVRGGAGGQSACPSPSGRQSAGERGRAVGSAGGAGGSGGQDAEGPIRGSGCDRDVCCGLADFSVPSDFEGPGAGENGGDGSAGSAGAGCTEPRGRFVGGTWRGGRGSAGSAGSPGAGGGGGGAGGGVVMDFIEDVCEFADGLGGGGGGGGAGGCGGGAGSEGSSGAPSIALLVVEPSAFTIENTLFAPARGGRGAPGGAGGDGGLGGVGASGGLVAPELRITPTLAGTYPGARGGSGGAGGAGGGGGGGCGGSSVGIWLVSGEPSSVGTWRMNRFTLGSGGEGGAGGGGAQTGSSGARGETLDVFVQR
jgi:hypothetical protein